MTSGPKQLVERRNYRKVYMRLWKSREFKALPDAMKVATLYVLTGPQTNRVGLFPYSFGQAADDLSTTIARAKERTIGVCRTFEWRFDTQAQVLWIPSWWIFNPVSENPKNLKGYLTDLNDVPRTVLIKPFCANLEHIPAPLHGLFDGWVEALSPRNTDGIGDAIGEVIGDPNTDRSTCTETCTETETNTETETDRPNAERSAQPVRPALQHYHDRFVARYRGKPTIGGAKDGARTSRLLKSVGLDEFTRRLDAFFESPDPWIQQSGHTLDVFFASGTQTKLVAQMARPQGMVSERTRQNAEGIDRVVRRIEGARR